MLMSVHGFVSFTCVRVRKLRHSYSRESLWLRLHPFELRLFQTSFAAEKGENLSRKSPQVLLSPEESSAAQASLPTVLPALACGREGPGGVLAGLLARGSAWPLHKVMNPVTEQVLQEIRACSWGWLVLFWEQDLREKLILVCQVLLCLSCSGIVASVFSFPHDVKFLKDSVGLICSHAPSLCLIGPLEVVLVSVNTAGKPLPLRTHLLSLDEQVPPQRDSSGPALFHSGSHHSGRVSVSCAHT